MPHVQPFDAARRAPPIPLVPLPEGGGSALVLGCAWLLPGKIQHHGPGAILLAGLLVGLAMVLASSVRAASLRKYLPYPVVIGLRAGIAVLVIHGWGRHLLASPATLSLAVLCLAAIRAWPRTWRLPGMVGVILAATVLVHSLGLPVATLQPGHAASAADGLRAAAMLALLAAVETLGCETRITTRRAAARTIVGTLLVLLLLGCLRWVPACSLAALLVLLAWRRGTLPAWRMGLQVPRSDVVVLVLTLVLAAAGQVIIALTAGVVVAAFLFLKQMTDQTRVLTPETRAQISEGAARPMRVPARVHAVAITGPVFFGTAARLRRLALPTAREGVVVLRFAEVPLLDATGLQALEALRRRCIRAGLRLMLSELHGQPLQILQRAWECEPARRIEMAHTLDEAFHRARARLHDHAIRKSLCRAA